MRQLAGLFAGTLVALVTWLLVSPLTGNNSYSKMTEPMAAIAFFGPVVGTMLPAIVSATNRRSFAMAALMLALTPVSAYLNFTAAWIATMIAGSGDITLWAGTVLAAALWQVPLIKGLKELLRAVPVIKAGIRRL